MTDTSAVDPVALARRLLSVGTRLVGGTIESIAVGRVPHPVAARGGSRARRGIAKERLSWCRRRGRGDSSLARLSGLGCGSGLDTANLVNPVLKRL